MIDPFVDHTPGKTSSLRAVGLDGREREKKAPSWVAGGWEMRAGVGM